MTVRLARRDVANLRQLSRGEYRPAPERHRGNPFFADFSCPGCGGLVAVAMPAHVVADDGAVEPTMTCPHYGCSFNEPIQLANWPAAADDDL